MQLIFSFLVASVIGVVSTLTLNRARSLDGRAKTNALRRTFTSVAPQSNSWLRAAVDGETFSDFEAEMVRVAEQSPALNVMGLFSAMAQSSIFRERYWQREPFLIKSPLKNLKDCFKMDDVKDAIDGDFMEAGRGCFQDGKSGWQMASVSTPKGSSFNDAKLQYDDVLLALKQSNGKRVSLLMIVSIGCVFIF